MGIGEPLDNLDNVLRFLELINLARRVNIGMRNISLSTCGVVPRIDAAGGGEPAAHAVRLAPRAGQRDPLRHDAGERRLRRGGADAACRRYQKRPAAASALSTPWCDGVNDHDWQADLSADLHPGHGCTCQSDPPQPGGRQPLSHGRRQLSGRFQKQLESPRRKRHGAPPPGQRYQRRLRPAAPRG